MSKTPDTAAQRAMGVRLQSIREVLDLTQEQLADVAGVSVSTVSGWEVGRNQIDLVKLAKLAERFKFTTDWVALGDLSGLRFDLAMKLQARARNHMAAPKVTRGRPARKQHQDDTPPLVRDADDGLPPPRGGTVHEPDTPFFHPTKHT